LNIKINKKINISPNTAPLVVAEISGNHNGSKKSFLKHIVAAAKNGADLVKIQTYEPDDIVIKSLSKKFLIKGGVWQNKNLWEIYKKAHTPFKWHKDAFRIARKYRIKLFSTPFSKRAVDLLEKFNVPLYKIASLEITDFQLIDYIAKKRKPIIISTGISNIHEIKKAIEIIKKYHNKIIILYCVSGYPTQEHESNLKTITYYSKIFKEYPIGISDHTSDISTSITATALGAKLIEKHFIISKKIKSVDSKFSIDSRQLKNLKLNVLRVYRSLGKNHKAIQKVERNNLKFRRSIFAIKDIKKGEKFTIKNIATFRPKIGIDSNQFFKILGKKAKKNIKKSNPIFFQAIQ
tara:strand:+ start:2557 stop:3603 length:1047 start_codon:yes stop_codon:yes gene_type:complete